jgi:hypothetical protein
VRSASGFLINECINLPAYPLIASGGFFFQIEKRERSGLTEEVVVFESSLSEAGFSGGPVFGMGGGVVGVVIENWETGSRATAVKPLLDKLEFAA